jgi:hypothetical protein
VHGGEEHFQHSLPDGRWRAECDRHAHRVFVFAIQFGAIMVRPHFTFSFPDVFFKFISRVYSMNLLLYTQVSDLPRVSFFLFEHNGADDEKHRFPCNMK